VFQTSCINDGSFLNKNGEKGKNSGSGIAYEGLYNFSVCTICVVLFNGAHKRAYSVLDSLFCNLLKGYS